MIKNPKVGDTVYFIDWDDTCTQGIITSLFCHCMSDYASVKDSIAGGIRQFPLSRLYFTQDECLKIIQYNSMQIQNEYRKQIKSLDDLIRFMYEHNFQGEDTDYDAKAVVKEKAKAFLEINLED